MKTKTPTQIVLELQLRSELMLLEHLILFYSQAAEMTSIVFNHSGTDHKAVHLITVEGKEFFNELGADISALKWKLQDKARFVRESLEGAENGY